MQNISYQASGNFIHYCKKSVALYINSLRNVITSRENKVHEMEIFSKGSWPLYIRFVRWFLLKINSTLHLSITTCIRILRIHCTEEPTGKQQLEGVWKVTIRENLTRLSYCAIKAHNLFLFFLLENNLWHVKCFRVRATEFIVPRCKTKPNFDFVKELHTKQETCQIRAEFFLFVIGNSSPSPAFFPLNFVLSDSSSLNQV